MYFSAHVHTNVYINGHIFVCICIFFVYIHISECIHIQDVLIVDSLNLVFMFCRARYSGPSSQPTLAHRRPPADMGVGVFVRNL